MAIYYLGEIEMLRLEVGKEMKRHENDSALTLFIEKYLKTVNASLPLKIAMSNVPYSRTLQLSEAKTERARDTCLFLPKILSSVDGRRLGP